MPQRVHSADPGTLHPLADGSFADTEGFGDVALGPAFLIETPRLEPSRLFPVAG
jgi:hypothetical protein